MPPILHRDTVGWALMPIGNCRPFLIFYASLSLSLCHWNYALTNPSNMFIFHSTMSGKESSPQSSVKNHSRVLFFSHNKDSHYNVRTLKNETKTLSYCCQGGLGQSRHSFHSDDPQQSHHSKLPNRFGSSGRTQLGAEDQQRRRVGSRILHVPSRSRNRELLLLN